MTEHLEKTIRCQRDVLQAFSHALNREAHVLTQHPDLLWQQLYNRLQWEGEEVKRILAPELEKRCKPEAKPWAKSRISFRESHSLIRTLIGHTDRVYGCSISPDGRWIVSVSADRTLRIWDPSNGKELRTLKGHALEINACAISPDGKWIVSASDDKTLKIWETSSGRELHTLVGHTDAILGVAINHKGTKIVSASQDKTLKIWDAIKFRELRTLKGHTDWVYGCAFNPDGSEIISASRDKTLKIWNSKSGWVKHTMSGHTDRVNACAVSPDNLWVLSSSWDQSLKIWNAASGIEMKTLSGQKIKDVWYFAPSAWSEASRGCDISPDGKWMVSAGQDQTVSLWDVATGQELQSFSGHRNRIYACAVSPDGTWIVSAGEDGTLRIWDASIREDNKINSGHTGRINAIAFSSDGTWVVSASSDRTLMIWDTSTGKERHAMRGCDYWMVFDCAISPGGKWMVSAGGDKSLRIWDTTSWQVLRILKGHFGMVFGCAISASGNRIVSASEDRTLKIWDPVTGEDLHTLSGHDLDVYDCDISPDDNWIVSASGDGNLKIWDLMKGDELRTFPGRQHYGGEKVIIKISRSGNSIISTERRKIKICRMSDGEDMCNQTGYTDHIVSFAVSPDGEYIITAHSDNTQKLWNLVTKKKILTIALGGVSCIAIHPWKPLAVFGDGGGGVYFLDLIGFTFGPIVTTAMRKDCGLVIRCPTCQNEHLINQKQLGNDLTCPTPGCGLVLRINPFTISSPEICEDLVVQPTKESKPVPKKPVSIPWYEIIESEMMGYVYIKCRYCGCIDFFEPRAGETPPGRCTECGKAR